MHGSCPKLSFHPRDPRSCPATNGDKGVRTGYAHYLHGGKVWHHCRVLLRYPSWVYTLPFAPHLSSDIPSRPPTNASQS